MPERWNRQFMEVKTITPVHIGSGQTLTNNADFVVDKQQVKIPNQKQLMDALDQIADTMSAEQFAQVESSTQLETLAQVMTTDFNDLSSCYTISHLGSQQKLYEIRDAIKTAFHQPLIPASSLKGALRSAFLAFYRYKLDTAEHSMPNGKDFEKAIKSFFGGQPQDDLLRAFKVGDISFTTDSLALDCARVISQNRDKQDKEKYKNYLEGFKAQAIGYGEILFDNNLLDIIQRYNQTDCQSVMSRLDNITMPHDWLSLATILRCHTLNFIEKEMQLLQGRHMLQHYRQFLQKLKQQMDGDPELVYLQLGYGSGWQGITGDVLTEKEKQQAKLGQRYPDFTFPKTRRINHQGLPLGWVQLKVVDDKTYQQALKQVNSDRPSAPKAMTQGEQWLKEKLDGLVSQNNTQESEALRGKQLAKVWQELDDPELKQSALEAIKARWQEKGWWDKPPQGKAAKKAKAIYNEGDNV